MKAGTAEGGAGAAASRSLWERFSAALRGRKVRFEDRAQAYCLCGTGRVPGVGSPVRPQGGVCRKLKAGCLAQRQEGHVQPGRRHAHKPCIPACLQSGPETIAVKDMADGDLWWAAEHMDGFSGVHGVLHRCWVWGTASQLVQLPHGPAWHGMAWCCPGSRLP